MREIFLGVKGKYIEKVVKRTEELTLLAKGDDTEIMHIKITPGETFYIVPGEEDRLMEFFYIIDGKVVYDDDGEDIYLNEGEYCYVNNLKETTYFKTMTEVTLLYITNQPVFYLLSDEIKKVTQLMALAKEKDIYTHDHETRTKKYVVGIGKKLCLAKGQLVMLCHSAIFHDIGKINVPDEILNKPGPLTFEEFECIKKHPADGAAIVGNTYLKEVALAILQHHERIDGSGYPQGLKGDEICIEAKIIAVVDTYDAMTSDRVYRKARSPRVAIDEIKSLVGKHYDGSVVNALEELLKEEGVI